MGNTTYNQKDKALRLARKHVHEGTMNSSVRFAMAEAVAAEGRGDLRSAVMWAAKSLSYSVGVGHPDYKAVKEMQDA